MIDNYCSNRIYLPPASLCPQAEELELLTAHDGATGVTGNLVNPNSSAPSLGNYHQAPIPMLLGADLGSSQFAYSEFAGAQMSGSSLQKAINANHMELDGKAQEGTAIASSAGKSDLELAHLTGANISTTEQEDGCPTCFEDYTAENPKIITKCNHHFHLSCILD